MREPTARAVLVLALLACGGAFAQPEPAATAPIPPPPDEYAAAVDPEESTAEGEGDLVYNFAQRPVAPLAEGQVDASYESGGIANPWGYSGLQVFFDNHSKKAQQIRLEFRSSSGGAVVRREVEVPAAQRASTWLLLPAGVTGGQLVASSSAFKNGVERRSLYLQAAQHAILALGTEPQFQAAAQRTPTLNTYDTFVRAAEPKDAPVELAAYVGFSEVVVLTPFEELSEAVRRALEGYAATGGVLILTRPPRNVDTFLPLLRQTAVGVHEYGFGHVRLCQPDTLACARGLTQDLGLAQREVMPSGGSQSFASRHAYAYDPNGGVPDHERFMLPQAMVPVGRFLLIILAFTLAIGPGSVWVARRRGPPMLLLTIPATAAVTCLLIVGYSVLVDGFTVHASTRGYTLLDSKNKRAISLGVEAFYANLAPGDARFDTSTAVVGPARVNNAQLATVDWTHGPLFDGDFVPSRTYREWGVLSVAPTRARLFARRSGDGVTVENGLGSDVRIARVRLGGEQWVVRELRDGGSQQARKVAVANAIVDAEDFPSRFGARALAFGRADLADGEFLAVVEGPSFLPTGGLRLSHQDSAQVVRGEVER